MIDTLVLDLDGPLLEGKERHYRCYSIILIEQGFTPIDIDQYWEMKRSRADRHQLLKLSNADAIYDLFLTTWMERIETQEYLMHDHLQEGVVDLLRSWNSSGIRLLLATMRNNSENLNWQLDRFNIRCFFDRILPVGSAAGSNGKAAKVSMALAEKPSRGAIWVGDTEIDIFSAKELGIAVCALECGLRTGEYLASLGADSIEPDLRAFAAKLQRS